MNIAQAVRHLAVMLIASAALPQQPVGQPQKEHTTGTHMVLLETGTPVPDPDRSALPGSPR